MEYSGVEGLSHQGHVLFTPEDTASTPLYIRGVEVECQYHIIYNVSNHICICVYR